MSIQSEDCLIPIKFLVRATLFAHVTWLQSNPDTMGTNKTLALIFDNNGDGLVSVYVTKCEKYRLNGDAIVGQ